MVSQIKETGLMCSRREVRGILDGSLDHTRRVVNPQPSWIASSGRWWWQIPKRGTPVIQLDINPAELGRSYPVKLAMQGDARAALRQMIDQADTAVSRSEWLGHIRQLVSQWRDAVGPLADSDVLPMRPERLCRELSEALPSYAVLVSDTGHAGIWTGTIWLTSHENPLADWIKDRMLAATDEDAVISKVYTGKTARFLKNKYIERWQQPDAPPTLPLPLQNMYSPMPIMISTEGGEGVARFEKPELRDWVSTPAGNATGLIKQRKAVRNIMHDMISEAVDILGD